MHKYVNELCIMETFVHRLGRYAANAGRVHKVKSGVAVKKVRDEPGESRRLNERRGRASSSYLDCLTPTTPFICRTTTENRAEARISCSLSIGHFFFFSFSPFKSGILTVSRLFP